jgi:hypothetical protein
MEELRSAVCRSFGVWPHESAQSSSVSRYTRKQNAAQQAGSLRPATERYSKTRA